MYRYFNSNPCGRIRLVDELRGMMSDLPPQKQRELEKLIKRYER